MIKSSLSKDMIEEIGNNDIVSYVKAKYLSTMLSKELINNKESKVKRIKI